MIKTFCDGCGRDYTANIAVDDKRIAGVSLVDETGAKTGKSTNVIPAKMLADVPEGLVICKYCLIDALNLLDDKPRDPIKPK